MPTNYPVNHSTQIGVECQVGKTRGQLIHLTDRQTDRKLVKRVDFKSTSLCVGPVT